MPAPAVRARAGPERGGVIVTAAGAPAGGGPARVGVEGSRVFLISVTLGAPGREHGGCVCNARVPKH